jgi:hypothetical protein
MQDPSAKALVFADPGGTSTGWGDDRLLDGGANLESFAAGGAETGADASSWQTTLTTAAVLPPDTVSPPDIEPSMAGQLTPSLEPDLGVQPIGARLAEIQDAQAHQQLLTIMSEVSADQHETSMAIIRNMGMDIDHNGNGWADWSE